MDIDSLLAVMFKPGFSSLDSFCDLIKVKKETLLKFLYRNKTDHYVSFIIKKKSGNDRVIKAPKTKMKALQRAVYEKLKDFYYPKPVVHGFLQERSIKTNAIPHSSKRYVFNIDLKDFFGSIHFGRVRNLLMSHPINAPHNVATVIAHICCSEGKLPQGAPTSPLIANMIMRKLDSQLQALARENKCHYTRYADDFSFSFTCSKRDLPRNIVDLSEDDSVAPGGKLKGIIEDNGFSINPEKTRLKPWFQRQMVTGLIVNEFPNVPRDFVRRTSSMINALKKYGAFNAEKAYIEIEEARSRQLKARQKIRVATKDGSHFLNVLNGRINYIQMVRGKSDPIYRGLAYRFSVASGSENKQLLKSSEEILGDSVFIVKNLTDDSQGTAFLLEGVGLVTNCHVISGVGYSMAPHMIEFYRVGESIPLSAELIYKDSQADLAVFSPREGFEEIPLLKKSKAELIRAQQPILSIGFPQHNDGDSHYISKGYTVQRRNFIGMDLWLVDIRLVKGNSGGPIFNAAMEVIGVATKGSSHNDHLTAFYGFIPISSLNFFVGKKAFLLSKFIHNAAASSKFLRIASVNGVWRSRLTL
nr:reverse transcriptase domain-containing protein [Pseudomonas sp.]